MNTEIIETDTFESAYGLCGKEAIVDHPEFGRLYVSQGYGWEDTLHGGNVRWECGRAVRIGKEDTLEGLGNCQWNEDYTYYDMVRSGYYGETLDWHGHMLANFANKIGL